MASAMTFAEAMEHVAQGLEMLVAADPVRTVAVTPTLRSVTVRASSC
jgi:hypothetical protein